MNWHTYFIYDHVTGNLIWKRRPLEHFAYEQAMLMWNTRYSGKVAGSVGSVNEYGHRTVSVDRKRVLIHRVIWEMHNSPIPEKMKVDHIDGNATNNRIENLRLATNSENSMNSRMKKNNTSGYKGVSYRKDSGKWRASIRKGDRQITIGDFKTPKEAHYAYVEAAKTLHGAVSYTHLTLPTKRIV